MTKVILKTTPTLYGSAFRNDNDLGLQHTPAVNTTINQKFDIHHTTTPTVGTRMAIGYYCMGNGALRSVPNVVDDTLSFGSVHHRPKNASLYNLLPFVAKHVSEDLSPAERLNYAMRVPVEIEGEYYWFYYLRKIIPTASENLFSEIVVSNGVITNTIPYTPTVADLSPVKPNFNINEAIPSTGNFYQVVKPLDISFTSDDVVLFNEALQLIYGDSDNRGIISELGLVAGYANTVPLLNENRVPVAGTYVESIRSIITDILNLDATNISSSTDGLRFIIDLGSTIPKYEKAV